MIVPKIIRTEEEYQAALAHLETLMDAIPGSPEEDELDLFALLVEKYEEEHFPIDLPDPIEAIKFRMEQQGLTRKDLVAYIGSQSKVSEVLNRKRSLSLSMIRALNEGLGIPAEVLLREPGKRLEVARFNPQAYPFTDMFTRGYFPGFRGSLRDAKTHGEELLEELFSVWKGNFPNFVFCRNSDSNVDENALAAWQARVMGLALQQELPVYSAESLTQDSIRELVKLSCFSGGPFLAGEWLAQRGIALVILPHLPHTYLDGACFITPSGKPVIGLTLRFDRLDNFWFTLAHELAHVILHLPKQNSVFFDDTDQGTRHSSNPQEIEANALAMELLIPADLWETEKDVLLTATDEAVVTAIAKKLQISPAIVAGRIRWETGIYSRFIDLVGSNQAGKAFMAR